MAKKGELIVGLDIGTTKVVAVVAEVDAEHGIQVVGFGQAPSRGLAKGVIVDIEATVASIKLAVTDAENMAGCKIDTVYAGIAGGHIKGFSSHGVAAVKGKDVRHEDVTRVLTLARAAAIPQDREIIHLLPQEFIIDGQDGIKSPVGICGVRLEARVHIVTAATSAIQNVIKCARMAGLKVAEVVLQPLASGAAVLTGEERELGVCLVDIGGGTTDVAIFGGGALVHTAVIPLGGNHLTNDIVVGLRTPTGDAERIKRQHGCAMSSLVSADEMIDVPSVGGRGPRRMARRILCDIIEPRVAEILELVGREIQGCGWEEQLTSGLVLTGGSSQLPGLEEMAEEMLGVLVRKGEPRDFAGLTDAVKGPQYATGVGLARFGLKKDDTFHTQRSSSGMFGRLGQWINEVF